jgi:threonine/homoserine/homoserine lactone efflux protein
VRIVLPGHVIKSESADVFKEEVVTKIANNDEVQWHWTLISQCIDSEADAVELLHQIVLLWVTIRGFSLAATWLEVYKKEAKKTTKQTTSLRRELSRSYKE